MLRGMPNNAARAVATSTLSTIMVSLRSCQRPGPASLPMSSRFSRPSAAQGGTGIGVGVGSGGTSWVGSGVPIGVAVGSKLASGMTRPVSGCAKMAVSASYAFTPTIVTVPYTTTTSASTPMSNGDLATRRIPESADQPVSRRSPRR